MTPLEFGAMVVRERKRLGMTQRQLAEACGLHQTDVSRVERGRRKNLHLGLMRRICAALGLELVVKVKRSK